MKILVISLKGLGDTLMALPLLRAVLRASPNSSMTILVPDKTCEELLHNISGVSTMRVDFRRPGPALVFQTLRLLWTLRAKHFDISVTTFPSNRPWYNMLAGWAHARLRVTHAYSHRPLGTLAFLQNRRVPALPPKHEVEHNLDLLEPMGLHSPTTPDASYVPSPGDGSFAENFLISNMLSGCPVIGLHPAINPSQVYKAWGAAALKTLGIFADWASSELGVKVLVFCGPDEKKAAGALLSGTVGGHLVFRDGTLGQTAALIARCTIFVNTDSGLGHLAAAVGTPVVTVFGPANPKMTRPYGPRNVVVSPGMPCSPCYDYPYASTGPRVKCGELNCLRDIDLPQLKTATLKLMGKHATD